jgi:hypothetical protein
MGMARVHSTLNATPAPGAAVAVDVDVDASAVDDVDADGKPPTSTKKARRASEEKWGQDVMALGFVIVPSLLFRAQQRLKITPTQLAVLMHLAEYWWEAGRYPHPSKKTLGDRVGLSARQVQRCIKELEDAQLVKRVERRQLHKGKTSNFYDLSGLIDKLKELEPQFRVVEDDAKAARKRVARPGVRPASK